MLIYESNTINFSYIDNNIQLEALQDVIKKEDSDNLITSLESFFKENTPTNVIFIVDRMSVLKNTGVFTNLIKFFRINREIIKIIYIVSNRSVVVSFINTILNTLNDNQVIFVTSLDKISEIIVKK